MGICTCCAACAAALVLNIISSIMITLGIIITVLGAILYWGSKLIFPVIIKLINGGADAVKGLQDFDLTKLNDILGNWGSLIGYAGLAVFIFGLILLAIGILGCVGACCRLKVVLIVYAIIMILVALAMFGLVIGITIYKPQFKTELQPVLKTQLKEQYGGRTNTNENNTFTIAMDLIQKQISCCGIYNYTDYYEAKQWNSTSSEQIPTSCCKTDVDTGKPTYNTCPSAPSETNSNRNTPCFTRIWELIDTYSKYVIYGLAGVGVLVSFLALITIIMIYHHAKNDLTPI